MSDYAACQCEHSSHFAQAEEEAPLEHPHGHPHERKDLIHVRSLHGTMLVCRACVTLGHILDGEGKTFHLHS